MSLNVISLLIGLPVVAVSTGVCLCQGVPDRLLSFNVTAGVRYIGPWTVFGVGKWASPSGDPKGGPRLRLGEVLAQPLPRRETFVGSG